ncbi:hypothetical protein PHLCEN_2v12008 [Hermanssonia centrifuga]|uniref:Uncharacterized protein n=1 Tax=Hermanssonia centrifuga TaxID=98765 RepID=A0A2R6NI95_9APHY|nr:hypothetical protein PHLCEN_2v12008 [Hermanssonia centrifuga]
MQNATALIEETDKLTLQTLNTEDPSIRWSKTQTNPLPDPTERFIMLTSLNNDGSHFQPAQITGLFAKLKYALRLVMLVEIKSQNNGGDAEQDLSVCRALGDWIHEHRTHSTFNRLCSLQHLASGFAYGDQKLPNIWWMDRVNWSKMLYKGDELSLANIQSMFANLEKRTTALWEQDILLGLQLRAEYTAIKEDLSNQQVGYSFLSDTRNPFLACRDTLVTPVLRNPELKKRFIYVANGSVQWRKTALAVWLANYTELNQNLMDDNLGDDYIGAEQTGHTVDTERMKNAVSPEALAGLPEDLFPLFLQASSEWQKVMKIVPGSLSLTYLEAGCGHFQALVEQKKISMKKVSNTGLQAAEINTEEIAAKVVNQITPQLLQHIDTMSNTIVERILAKLSSNLVSATPLPNYSAGSTITSLSALVPTPLSPSPPSSPVMLPSPPLPSAAQYPQICHHPNLYPSVSHPQ